LKNRFRARFDCVAHVSRVQNTMFYTALKSKSFSRRVRVPSHPRSPECCSMIFGLKTKTSPKSTTQRSNARQTRTTRPNDKSVLRETRFPIRSNDFFFAIYTSHGIVRGIRPRCTNDEQTRFCNAYGETLFFVYLTRVFA